VTVPAVTIVLEEEWPVPVHPTRSPRFALGGMRYAGRLVPPGVLAQSSVHDGNVRRGPADSLPRYARDT
jgi:hypothetical protein